LLVTTKRAGAGLLDTDLSGEVSGWKTIFAMKCRGGLEDEALNGFSNNSCWKFYGNMKLLRKPFGSTKLLRELIASHAMDTSNEKLRQQVSERLKRELGRLGMPLGSPTQIAHEFNTRFPGRKVAAQTVRKRLFGDAIPTQAKLISLAEWLDASPQWLRYGIGPRRGERSGPPLPALKSSPGVFVVSADQAALVPVVDLLTRLSPPNVRLAESIIRCILAEQLSK
jgi:hypothetical protein